MSKADSIQKKLDKAYGKVAKLLGRDFDIYRRDTIDDPIQSAYWLDTQKVSFSKDDKYKASAKDGLSIWNAWMDGNLESHFDLQNGDILYSSATSETFMIVGIEPHLTHRAIKANGRITIIRAGATGYGNNDATGFAPGNVSTSTTIATEVPCQILQPSSYGAAAYIPAGNNATDNIPNFEIYLFDINKEVQIRDKITDASGNIAEVQAIYQTDVGTKLTCRGIPQ